MAMNWRRGAVFVGGLLLGAVLAAALVGQGRNGSAKPTNSAADTAPAAVPVVAVRPVDCSFAPIVTRAGSEDGLLPLDKDLQGNSPSAVATLILTGKEAAAAGKPRDAETSFLMACRSAESVRNNPVPLADAHYQLARHYVQVAGGPGVAKRDEMLRRAEALYANSLQVYREHRGAEHEKTRFALQGLQELQQLRGTSVAGAGPAADTRMAATVPSAPVAGSAPAAPPAPAAPAAPVTRATPAAPVTPVAPAAPAAPVARAAPAAPAAPVQPPVAATPAPATKAPAAPPAVRAARPAPAAPVDPTAPAARSESAAAPAAQSAPAQPQRQARRTAPSFDCARARSTTEKLICDDEDLARQDRELGRLHQRARQAAADPRAFQRESDAEWAQREATCTDRECLQRWYAKRRAELSAQGERPAARPAAQRPAPAAAPQRAPESRRTETAERPAPVRTEEPPTRASGGPPAARQPVVTAPREVPVETISEPPATATGSTSDPGTE